MLALEDLELMAYQQKELPEGLSFLEEYYYIALRSIYRDYKNGKIEREQANAEKLRLKGDFMRRFELEKERLDAYKKMADDIRTAEQLRFDCMNNDNDLKALAKILLQYVSLTTGDKLFYTSAVRKWGLE